MDSKTKTSLTASSDSEGKELPTVSSRDLLVQLDDMEREWVETEEFLRFISLNKLGEQIVQVTFSPTLSPSHLKDYNFHPSRAMAKWMQMHQSCKHPNLVTFLGHNFDEEVSFVLTEPTGKRLADMMDDFTKVSEVQRLTWFRDIISAVQAIVKQHGKEVLIRLNPDTICITESGKIVLFSYLYVNIPKSSFRSSTCNRKFYPSLAPEIATTLGCVDDFGLVIKRNTKKTVVWSLGLLLALFYQIEHDWCNVTSGDYIEELEAKKKITWEKYSESKFQSQFHEKSYTLAGLLIDQCLQYSPEDRISLDDMEIQVQKILTFAQK